MTDHDPLALAEVKAVLRRYYVVQEEVPVIAMEHDLANAVMSYGSERAAEAFERAAKECEAVAEIWSTDYGDPNGLGETAAKACVNRIRALAGGYKR